MLQIQFNRHKYKCQDCEREFTAKDEKNPQKGRFGMNIDKVRTAAWTMEERKQQKEVWDKEMADSEAF